MIRVFSDSSFLYKSYLIEDIYDYITSNPDLDFTFIKDGDIISSSDVCKLYLREAKNYDDYIKLENILNQKTTVNAFIQNLRTDI